MTRRGFTLIEMLVTVAIGSIIVAAALATGTLMMQLFQRDSRQAYAESQVALSLAVLDRTLSNTGASFPVGRYSFRVINNVVDGTNLANLDVAVSNVPVVARAAIGAATPVAQGIVAGTDVIEVAMSDSGLRRPGLVSAGFTSACSANCTVTLANADPFLDAEITTVTPRIIVVLDERNPDQACLGRVTAITNATSPAVTFTPLPFDYASGAASCASVQVGWVAYVLERRVRLFIYQQTTGELVLATQDGDGNGAFADLATTPPTILALSLENMQVTPIVGAKYDGTNNVVDTCTATVSPAVVCLCNDPAVPAGTECVVTANASANWPAALSYQRGATIQLTARAQPLQGARQPRSMDWNGGAPGAIDNFARVQLSTGVQFLNGGTPTQ